MFCPYCENRILLTKFNDLATKRPDLLKFYDYDKNELPPEQLLISSYDPDTWWICDEGHSFQRSVARMCETTSCLVCDRKLVVPGVNDAEFAYPKIVSIWDYDKNECLPSEISDRNQDKHWYKCEHGHSYEAYLEPMIHNDFNCLICDNIMIVPGINSLADTHTELCKEISPNEERDPHTLAKTWTYSMLWRCQKCGEDYHYPVCDRELGDDDCPFCNNRYTKFGVNSLVDTHPDLAKEYSPTNDYSVERVNKNTVTKAKWICPTCSGEYWYSIAEREVGDDSCPYCKGERPLAGYNTLETVLDDIQEVWANTNERSYSEFTSSYKQPADWICKKCGGIYSESIESFVEKHLKGEDDCPFCNGRKPLKGFNTIKAVNPPWFKEWSYQYNYLICDPDEVLPTYGEKVWFECSNCHHEYFMSPKDREMFEMRHKVACPDCKGLRRKKKYFF